MSNCLFCKIIAGQIPNYTVYQDENVLAFLDIHPCSKGHTVVIPKKHFNNLQEVDNDSWDKLMRGVRETMKKIQSILRPDGLNLGINDRPASGQAVGHAHWHIIPRYNGDGGGSMHSIIKTKEPVDVKKIAESLFES